MGLDFAAVKESSELQKSSEHDAWSPQRARQEQTGCFPSRSRKFVGKRFYPKIYRATLPYQLGQPAQPAQEAQHQDGTSLSGALKFTKILREFSVVCLNAPNKRLHGQVPQESAAKDVCFFNQVFNMNSISVEQDAFSIVRNAEAAIAEINSGLSRDGYRPPLTRRLTVMATMWSQPCRDARRCTSAHASLTRRPLWRSNAKDYVDKF